MLPYATSTKDTLTHYLPRPEVHSTCNFHSLFWGTSIFADLGNRGHPTVQILHMKIHYGHTTSCPLPSPPTYDSLSLLISPSNGAISTVFANFPISSSIFSFSTVMRKWWWYHQHCISGIITHKFKPTEALDTALLHLSLANPVLKPEVCKTQDHEGSSQL